MVTSGGLSRKGSAKRTFLQLLFPLRVLTFVIAGLASSIGVLLIATNSYEDQSIPPGVSILDPPNAAAVGRNNTVPVTATDKR